MVCPNQIILKFNSITFTLIITFLILNPSTTIVAYGSETSQSNDLSWNLEAINIQGAWDITKGNQNITVAIVDSGINWNVTALSMDNRWENQLERDGLPGIDDDNNGFIDDIYGYDFTCSL